MAARWPGSSGNGDRRWLVPGLDGMMPAAMLGKQPLHVGKQPPACMAATARARSGSRPAWLDRGSRNPTAGMPTLLSAGVQPLGRRHRRPPCGYDLLSVDGEPALDHLLDALPAAWRERLRCPPTWSTSARRPAAVNHLRCNHHGQRRRFADPEHGATAGRQFHWGVRDPLAAADEMATCWPAPRRPSLISRSIFVHRRGPWFTARPDQDLAALTRRFPGMPVPAPTAPARSPFS